MALKVLKETGHYTENAANVKATALRLHSRLKDLDRKLNMAKAQTIRRWKVLKRVQILRDTACLAMKFRLYPEVNRES